MARQELTKRKFDTMVGMLKEIGSKTTEPTRFNVVSKWGDNCTERYIDLTPCCGNAFFHMEQVVDIVRAFGMSIFVYSYEDTHCFGVHIYE